jgi:predicted nucleotidyltransferase component of viral defense system
MEITHQRFSGVNMIPLTYIIEHAGIAPWQEPRQVEQDLIITKALLAIYSHPLLKENLAFRGGTALNKLFFNPTSRYSEDIDLVQVHAQPIGPTINLIREVIDPWLGKPDRDFSFICSTLTYYTTSEDGFPMQLKIEINTREHQASMGFKSLPFTCNSEWSNGSTTIYTYALEELLGTKLRALYQRRKGRDLYDVYTALITFSFLNHNSILDCFSLYTAKEHISKLQFLTNLEEKLKDGAFRTDILPLLPRQKQTYDPDEAFKFVATQLIEKLQG